MAVRTEDGGEPLAIADVNGANDKEVRVSISGQQTSIKQRVKSTGWKFSDLSGAAYKWIVQNKETGWQLHDRRGNAVAGFDGNQFWNVSEELRLLALLSWALSAITTFGSRPGNGSKARASTTVLNILSNTPHREHQNVLPDFY
ncbi:hypothetical protein DL89DRAFT_270179 [Linderina pennispora]|uniref:Uncharacterized protein n=1 Tax=Linderina pennispora TaxID=61395 RepID=A0A1Y1VZF4_9FUNG|nr:uncharacterized protein DL89DRAFT_270179 [Linderina pennispora]ORX66657.1 hypothetical protein DL89DRAFT_270179 [Linderina pennispora]